MEEELAQLRSRLVELEAELRDVKGSNFLMENWPAQLGGCTVERAPPQGLMELLAVPADEREPGELPTLSVDSCKRGALKHGLAVGLHYFDHDPTLGPEDMSEAWKRKSVYVSEKLAKFMDASDSAAAQRAMDNTVAANVALRMNETGIVKSYLHGDFHPFMIRTVVFHPTDAADIAMMWFIPCILRHEGSVKKFGAVNYVSKEQTSLRMYEAVMHDHLGLKFTPAIVSVVDKEGYIIHQNAASMAALGMQGHLHRSQHCPGGLNLLDELFCEDPAARAEFQSVTDANNMFSMVMKIRSPVMRRWLEVGTRDVWHQVQISKAKDAVTLKEVYVVAQVDVSSTVLIEHTVMQLQAENHDLHWTTAWLEDQKRKTEELNQRLKDSLVEALAVRDEKFKASIVIDTDSPADKAIKLLNKILEGQEVSSGEILAVREVLMHAGTDFLHPVNFQQQMGAQIGHSLDEDVGRSLIDLLTTRKGIDFGGEAEVEEEDQFGLEGPRSACPDLYRGHSTDDDTSVLSQGHHHSSSWGQLGGGGHYQPYQERTSNGHKARVVASHSLPLSASLPSPRAVRSTSGGGTKEGDMRQDSLRNSLDFSSNYAGHSLPDSTVTSTYASASASTASDTIPARPSWLQQQPATSQQNLLAQVSPRTRPTQLTSPGQPPLVHAASSGSCSTVSDTADAPHPSGTVPKSASTGGNLGSACARPPALQVGGTSSPGCQRWTVGSHREGKSSSKSAVDRSQVVALMEIARSPPDHLTRVLGASDSWGWDPFQLSEVTGGKPLSALSYWLLKRHHGECLKACHVDEVRLCRFLVRVEEGYVDNPYHNRIHASDVVQWTHMLATHGGVFNTVQVGDAGVLAVYLAATVHDLGHKGLNNDFLVRSGDALALLYNDASPMENHHLATTFQMLAQEPYNFLARAPPKVRDTVRKLVITMVLATDMKQHFAQLSLFKSKLGVSDSDGAEGGSPSAPATAANSGPLPEAGKGVAASVVMDDEIKSLCLAVALKCADLGNLAALGPVNRRWVQHLEEEYFRQGDREKASNLTVSALMDRAKGGASKSQEGFFGVVGLPLFRSFVKAFPLARPMLESAEANLEYWRSVEEEARRRCSSKQVSVPGLATTAPSSQAGATESGSHGSQAAGEGPQSQPQT